MVVDGKLEVCISGTIDETKAVTGSGNKRSFKARASIIIDVGPIDQAIVQSWWTILSSFHCQDICSRVRPIVEEEIAEIFIVICGSRAIDNDASQNAIPSLDVEMRVIPTGSVLCSSPRVSERVSWSNRALGDARNTIHLIGIVLTNAVEVD